MKLPLHYLFLIISGVLFLLGFLEVGGESGAGLGRAFGSIFFALFLIRLYVRHLSH